MKYPIPSTNNAKTQAGARAAAHGFFFFTEKWWHDTHPKSLPKITPCTWGQKSAHKCECGSWACRRLNHYIQLRFHEILYWKCLENISLANFLVLAVYECPIPSTNNAKKQAWARAATLIIFFKEKWWHDMILTPKVCSKLRGSLHIGSNNLQSCISIFIHLRFHEIFSKRRAKFQSLSRNV